jgi:Protein of unknown function (DUF2490)
MDRKNAVVMKWSMVALLLIATTRVMSQQQNTTSVWLGIQANVQVAPRWQWVNDAGYRTEAFSADARQFLFRTGLRRQLNGHWAAAGGAAFFFTRNARQPRYFNEELRSWQDLLHQTEMRNRFSLLQRLRTEQRGFINQPSKARPALAWRLRYRVAAECTLTNRFRVQVYNEYMYQLQKSNNGFEQNRTGILCSYRVNKHTELVPGYIYIHQPKQNTQVLLLTVINTTGNGRSKK